MTREILVDTAREAVERSVGLRLDPAQRHRLDYWLHHTAVERGVPDAELVAEIAAEGPALQAVLDELTVQETSFFRDPAQFAAFRDDIVPTLSTPLTVWSAGCAGGHEPYSIAMVLAESGLERWRVVATDISSRALGQARAARYDERQLAGLGERERSRYLRRAGNEWEVVPALRSRVSVLRQNLIRDPAPEEVSGAAVVFCRNVLIYFGRVDVLAALERIATTMDPRGWVFLGYSESLWQVTERFRLVRTGAAFAYRQPEEPQNVSGHDAPAAAQLGPPRRGGPHASRPGSPMAAPVEGRRGAGALDPDGFCHGPGLGAPAPEGPAAAEATAESSSRPGEDGDPSIAALLAEGEAGLEAGDAPAAIGALRKVVYLDPDHAIAHFQLGLAFELQGDDGQARRAFSAARSALRRSTAAAEAALEGYHVTELTRLIERRLTRSRTP
jgi:chemotaxis protein methyltransferase CheR